MIILLESAINDYSYKDGTKFFIEKQGYKYHSIYVNIVDFYILIYKIKNF